MLLRVTEDNGTDDGIPAIIHVDKIAYIRSLGKVGKNALLLVIFDDGRELNIHGTRDEFFGRAIRLFES